MTDKQANIWLPATTITTVNTLLRRLLWNEVVLQIKLKQFHWNVRWPHFTELHALFDTMQGELSPIIDDTAERIRSLGIDAPGTMKEFLADATLKEYPTQDTDATTMLTLLLTDYEQIIQEIRQDITTCVDAGDDGNADFLTAIMEQHEKTAWMLRATIS